MLLRDPLIGQQLAQYRIDQLIGHGGMAKVYLGWDVTLQRSVAIKVIDDRFRDDPAYSERFLREARTMATWRHPNIPQVYNAGEQAGVLYFAMEYIPGQNLAQLLRQRLALGELLSYAEILQIGWAVAEALDYAHGKGVIHRDVTPANVILSEDNRVVLMDFGLALDVIEGTRGEVFGTPHYIAPEQARSSAEAVPQTDLYALGVMLYEMLTGIVPFDDSSPASLALKHITEEPPPPSQINPEIGPQVEAVLLITLRKKPEERYQSGKELMEALEGALYSQPATLAELPGKPGDYPASTLAELPVIGRTRSRPEIPPPAAQAAQVKRAEPGAQRKRYLLFGGLGCGLLALVCFALVVRGAALLLGQRDTPTTTRRADPIAWITSSPTFTPARTSDQEPAHTTAQTPTITGSHTPSPTPTPTLTPTPSYTPTPLVVYELLIVGYKDDSLFVMNEGEDSFPLEPLEFKNNAGGVLGEEWKVKYLDRRDCVALWKEEGRPKAPKDLKCDEVGERLERSGLEKFWILEFDVLYQGQKIGTCNPQREQCTVRIEIRGR